MSERDSICASAEKPEVEYRDAPGLPEGFRVGNDGSFWTRWNGRQTPELKNEWRRLNLAKATNGYLRGKIEFRKVTYRFTISRLVLLAFVGEPPTSKHEAAHLDGDKENNALNNLQWKTRKENEADKVLHGTVARGSRGGNSVLDETAVADIRRKYVSGSRQTELAAEYGVRQATIWAIVNNVGWNHVEACKPEQAKWNHRNRPAMIAKCAELRAAGLSCRQIAELIGYSKTHVRNLLKEGVARWR
jgi:hypothetical protein